MTGYLPFKILICYIVLLLCAYNLILKSCTKKSEIGMIC